MKGLENLFAKTFEEEAKKRGFVVADNIPPVPFANPFYKNKEWVIGSLMTTMFPDTTVRIKISPLNPPPESSLQHLLGCEATWSNDLEKWTMLGRNYTCSELISHAFDQMQNPIYG